MTDKLTPVRCGCGGEAKVAFCQQSYFGQNCFGDKKIKYRVYMICKKCHARGKPIITDWLINPHPWDSIYSGRIRHNAEQDEMFAPYVERAIEAWNRAMGIAEKSSIVERNRKFLEIVTKYPKICAYPEYEGKPYYSIKYEENGETIVGFGTYKPDVLSQYLREYFISSAEPERKKGEWVEYPDCLRYEGAYADD